MTIIDLRASNKLPPKFDYVLVPVSTKQPDGLIANGLTEEMYQAFWSAFDQAYKHRGHKESTGIAYNAMIGARPSAP